MFLIMTKIYRILLMRRQKKEENMIGAIIGDVVGSRFEYKNNKSKDFELITDKNFYTDDTVMTVAVMDILCSGDASKQNIVKTMQKWGMNYPGRGYGNMFAMWLMSGDEAKPYNSYGNGAAMRISPVGWYAKSEDEVKTLSKAITEVTHNHPEGLKGAETVAMCVYKALHGAKKSELKHYICSQYPEIANFKYEDLKETYFFTESCQDSVPEALFCFLISDNFEDCLRTTVSIGGDTDTLCAISCAVAEAYYKYINKDLAKRVLNKLSPEMIAVIMDFMRKRQ